MRLHKYIHLVEAEGRHYLFDISNGKAIALHPALFSLIRDHRHSIDDLEHIHPELYASLLSNAMIIEDGADETELLIDSFIAIDRDPSVFDIIINPTLDCNLRCWYCYETHTHGTMMSEEILNRVKQLIHNKVDNPELRHLSVNFFGGEPMLGWNKVVMPLLTYTSELCANLEVSLSVGFTTNGVLLTSDKLAKLSALGLDSTSFQITLDGNRVFHDASRVGAAKLPTYDIILRNVIEAASKGFNINLRFNYTPDSLQSFIDVLGELEDLPQETKNHINCSFQEVWQTADKSVRDKATQLADMFRGNGISASSDIIYHRHLCYADRENHITVNYNGDLYKCTAREFTPSTREGILSADGNIEINDRYRTRMSLKYSNPVCRKCDILPLCNGRCSQGKLERKDGNEKCILNYDDATRQLIILGSLYQNLTGRTLTLNDLKSRAHTII